MDPGEQPSELAVETLLADLALTRLGTLLQGARQQHSSSRRDVASKVGTTARELRRYETGAAPVPPGIVTALAEFYGDDLNTEFSPAGRTSSGPAQVVDDPKTKSADADGVLRTYLGILRRDPQVTLSAVDIAALSTALAVEPEEVEGRISELLVFTTGLRRNNRLRRRRRILSGAGLGVLCATGAGFGIGALVGALPSRADPASVVLSPSTTTGVLSTTVAATSTTTATSSTTTAASSTTLPAPPESVGPPPAAIAPPPITDPPTTALGIGTAVTVVETTTTTTTTTPPPTTTTLPRPHISTDTTPISIPGTEPVTIITGP